MTTVAANSGVTFEEKLDHYNEFNNRFSPCFIWQKYKS